MPSVALGMSRTETEVLDGYDMITILPGDTVYFYAEAYCDPGGDDEVPTAGEIVWESNDLPDGIEYGYTVYRGEGAPPQAPPESSSEKWRNWKQFNSPGVYTLAVTVTREDPPQDWPDRPVQTTFHFCVCVVEAHVEEVSFYRQPIDPQSGPTASVRMRKRNPDWHDDALGDDCVIGAPYINPPQWPGGAAGPLPVCYPKDQPGQGNQRDPVLLVLKVRVVFTNPQEEYGEYMPFDLSGESADPLDPNVKLHFSGQGCATGGPMSDLVVATTTDALPLRVCNGTRTFSWKVRTVGDNWQQLNNTTNPFWVTWDYPMFGATWGVTAKRINWVTQAANGCASESAIGQAIWNALSGDPPLDPLEGSGKEEHRCPDWRLLEGFPYWGDCTPQAAFMVQALMMLGVGSGMGVVHASTADQDCNSWEGRECPHGHGQEWLMFNHGGEYHGIAACCTVAGASVWYCLFPVLSGSSDWQILWQMGCPPNNFQRWVSTRHGGPPSAPSDITGQCDTEPTPQP